jgi:hypothetical protein
VTSPDSASTRWHDLLRFSVLSSIGGVVAEQLGRDRGWLGLLVLVVTLSVGAGFVSSGLVARRDSGSAGQRDVVALERRAAGWRIATGALCAVAATGGFALSRLAFP